MNELVILQNLSINHKIIYAKTNRLTLRYDRSGLLHIRCPLNIKDAELIDFVNRHLTWITKNYNTNRPLISSYQDGAEYLFRGIKYRLSVIISKHQGVFLNDDTIIIYTSSSNQVKQLLDKWKLEQAELLFNELFYQCFKDMEKDINTYPKLLIKHYLSRWGCCYPMRNQIVLNLALIHVDIELIKYVIYHELAHLKYHNHQNEFHNYLQKYCPNERKLKKLLRNYRTDY